MVSARESLVVLAVLVLITSSGIIDRWVAPPPGMDDPGLVAEVAGRLMPPCTGPYNLAGTPAWGQAGQLCVIQALTRNKTGGVFVESGAHDGESMSNSLLLETEFGWRGLLVEPSQQLFPQIRGRGRRAWALQACLSHTPHPFQTQLRDQLKYGLSTVEDGFVSQHLSSYAKNFHPRQQLPRYPVECYPLFTILRAWNQTSVDLLSLDIEGMEMGVMANLPWHLVDIKMVLVETFLSYLWNPNTDLMRWFMEERGYLAMRLQHDWLFVKKDCEYARDAEAIVKRVRHDITKLKDSHVADPFND